MVPSLGHSGWSRPWDTVGGPVPGTQWVVPSLGHSGWSRPWDTVGGPRHSRLALVKYRSTRGSNEWLHDKPLCCFSTRIYHGIRNCCDVNVSSFCLRMFNRITCGLGLSTFTLLPSTELLYTRKCKPMKLVHALFIRKVYRCI